MESARTIVVSVDSSATSVSALKWCLKNVWRENDSLHLVTVLHPLTLSAYPVTPVVTSASVSAIVHHTEMQRKHEEVEAHRILQEALQKATSEFSIPSAQVHTHALPAAGGASGVADSIVEYSKAVEAAVVIVGSRGLGSFQRSMMSLVGLGSVSDYCVHNLPCPVVVVKNGVHKAEQAAGQTAAETKPRKVLLAPDSSQQSQIAMEWAFQHLLHREDEVHIISVALPQAFTMVDEGSPAIAALEAEEWRRCNTQAQADAQLVCERVAQHLVHSRIVPPENVWQRALAPQGGASDVGATICNYAKQQGIDVVVLGSRGLGAFKRSMMTLVGLGSVGDYCVHNLQCAVVVVKGRPDVHLTHESEEQVARAEAAATAAEPAAAAAAAPVPVVPVEGK